MLRLPIAIVMTAAFACACGAQEKTKTERTIVDVRYGSAKNLAEVLNKHFKSDLEFQAVPESTSNVLLLSGTKPILAEAKEVLEKLDRASRQVTLEIWIAELSPPGMGAEVASKTLHGPLEEVRNRLEELHRKGQITVLRRYELKASENQAATLSHLENRPFASGSSATFGGGGPGGRKTMSVTFRAVGVKMSATARIPPGGEIALDLNLEDSRPNSSADAPVVANDDAGNPIRATDFLSTMVEGKLTLRPGYATQVQGTVTRSKLGTGQTLIVVGVAMAEMKAK